MHQMLMSTMDTIKIANRDCNRFVCRDACYVFHGVRRVILCKYPPLIFLWLIVPQLTVGTQSVVSIGRFTRRPFWVAIAHVRGPSVQWPGSVHLDHRHEPVRLEAWLHRWHTEKYCRASRALPLGHPGEAQDSAVGRCPRDRDTCQCFPRSQLRPVVRV